LASSPARPVAYELSEADTIWLPLTEPERELPVALNDSVYHVPVAVENDAPPTADSSVGPNVGAIVGFGALPGLPKFAGLRRSYGKRFPTATRALALDVGASLTTFRSLPG